MESAIATSINVEETFKNVGKLQSEINEKKEVIGKAFRAILHQSEAMEEDKFWELIENLNKTIKRTENHKVGTENFMHNLAFGHSKVSGEATTVEDGFSFVKAYEEMSGKISKPLWDVIEGFGDDGYGDVIDSFLLFGKERYLKALEGEIEGKSEDQYQGENYMSMHLENDLEEKFAIGCVHYE
jgi:hypothetical protein